MDNSTEQKVSELVKLFVETGNELSQLWLTDLDVADALNNDLYPNVESFNELMQDFSMWGARYQDVINITKKNDEKIPITFAQIKHTCGWSEFAELTNRNVYAQKEFGFSDREIFDVSLEDARSLGIIK